jgi:regulatory protein
MSTAKINKASAAPADWVSAEDFVKQQQVGAAPLADAPPSLLYSSALRMLGLREHSAYELAQKLQKKFAAAPLSEINETLALLTEQDYINPARYVDALTRTSISKGKGPAHIAHKLRQAKVDVNSKHLPAVDWVSEAHKTHLKKFGQLPTTTSEHAAQYRFMASRGYPHAAIMAVLRPTKD